MNSQHSLKRQPLRSIADDSFPSSLGHSEGTEAEASKGVLSYPAKIGFWKNAKQSNFDLLRGEIEPNPSITISVSRGGRND